MDRLQGLISAYQVLHSLHPNHKLLSLMTPGEHDILSIDYKGLEERYRAKLTLPAEVDDAQAEMMTLYCAELRDVVKVELTNRLERDGLLGVVRRFYDEKP